MKPQGSGKSFDLSSVAVGYEPISKAPTASDLWLKDPTGKLLKEEAEKRYKAVDRYGNVYLIQNPAVWEVKIVNGMRIKCRPEPKLILSAAAAEAESKNAAPPVISSATQATGSQQSNYGFLGER